MVGKLGHSLSGSSCEVWTLLWGFFLLFMGLVGLRASRVDDNGLKLELVSEVYT